MVGHEDSGTTFGAGALALQSLDLVGAGIDLVVFKDGKLNLLVGVLDLLGLSVGLLLLLLTATLKGKGELYNRKIFDARLSKSHAISKKGSSGDESLLGSGDAWRLRV